MAGVCLNLQETTMTAFAFLYPMMFLLVSSYLGEFVEARAIRRQGLNPSTHQPNSRRRLSASTREVKSQLPDEFSITAPDVKVRLTCLAGQMNSETRRMAELRESIQKLEETTKHVDKTATRNRYVFEMTVAKLEFFCTWHDARDNRISNHEARLSLLCDNLKPLVKPRKPKWSQLEKRRRNKINKTEMIDINPLTATPKASTPSPKQTRKRGRKNRRNNQNKSQDPPTPTALTPSPIPQLRRPLSADTSAVTAPTETSENTSCQPIEFSDNIGNSVNTLRQRKTPIDSTQPPPPQLRQPFNAEKSAVTGPTKKSNPVRFNSANRGKHPTGQSSPYKPETITPREASRISGSKPKQGNGPGHNKQKARN